MGVIRRLVRLGLLLLMVTTLAVTASWIYHGRAAFDGQNLAEANAPILVLSSGMLEDGRPDPQSAGRTQQALALLRSGKGSVVILSGGFFEDPPGVIAESMQTFAVAEGADPARLIIEGKATSTLENLLYTAEILEERGLGAPILVTDAFHMGRARVLAWQLGIDIAGVSTSNVLDGTSAGHQLFTLGREVLATGHNVARGSVWATLGLLGYDTAERQAFIEALPLSGLSELSIF